MRWGSPHAVLTSLLGVEGALFFGALLQDFFIDKHNADLYSTVFDMLIGPMFFVGLAATVVGCVVGAFLGKLLLKKHFQKAGIV